MNSKLRLFFLFFICFFLLSGCFPKAKVLQKEVWVSSDSTTLPYRTFFPKVHKGNKVPLILFLHGSGERGTDNEKQLIHVVPYLTSDSFQRLYPSIVLAPQCPEQDYWGPVQRFEWTVINNGQVTPAMKALIELMEKVVTWPEVDLQRIYICGLSMGGIGSYDILHRKHDLFAAAIPICGTADLDQVYKYKDVPLWIFHGGDDTVIPVQKSRDVVTKMLELGTQIRYTEYSSEGHGIWEKAIREKGLWEWVFAQHK